MERMIEEIEKRINLTNDTLSILEHLGDESVVTKIVEHIKKELSFCLQLAKEEQEKIDKMKKRYIEIFEGAHEACKEVCFPKDCSFEERELFINMHKGDE